jgi:alkylated DNA repair dioxygenase AlkB
MKIILENAVLEYFDNFYSEEKANILFNHLRSEILWKQDEIKIFGKVHNVPRLQAWYGDKEKSYSYSGIKMEPNKWIDSLSTIKFDVEKLTGYKVNSVLANLYRNGNDSNGWHADDEKELGENPVIASLSLGESRKFKMKHKEDKSIKKDILLTNGSLLIMSGETQEKWKHTIAKTKLKVGERINLTFRYIH